MSDQAGASNNPAPSQAVNPSEPTGEIPQNPSTPPPQEFPPNPPPASYLQPNIHHARHENLPPATPEPKPDNHPDKSSKNADDKKADEDGHKIDFIKTTQTNTYKKDDPPLFDLKMTNPVTYLKKWWTRVMANEGIIFSFRIRPLTAVLLIIALGAAGGTSFSLVKVFFPTSSPIFHREVIYQGEFQKTSSGEYYLILPDNSLYKLNSREDLTDLTNLRVMVKGNLTKEPNVIDVKEITQFN